MNKRYILKKVLLGTTLLILGPLLLTATNVLAPVRPEIDLPPPLIKYKVGCFIAGEPIFMGDVLGQIKMSSQGEITFFSLEWNAQVKLVNASCISTESRIINPSVHREGDTSNNSDPIIL